MIWEYKVNDVLLIAHKEVEQVARVAGYVDALDDTMPILVNLRVSGGLRWGQRQVKITKDQIMKPLPEWYVEQHEKWEASIQKTAADIYAKMTPAQRAHLEAQEERRRRRSPLDILIDRSMGIY